MYREEKYMSEVVKEEYRNWPLGSMIIFDADTNCGKTSFVYDKLIPYLEEEQQTLLYLSNRVKLKDKLKLRTNNRTGVKVMLYQDLQEMLKYGKEPQHYDYIVVDEAHYFYSDVSFNLYTWLAWEYITRQTGSTIIFMSATASDLFGMLIENFDIPKENVYQLKKVHSQVDKIYFYNDKRRKKGEEKQRVLTAIIDDILENSADEKILVFLKSISDLNDMHKIYGKNATYYCSKTRKQGYRDEDCITENEEMKGRLLFTTTALDNGIDIKDERLKHIFVELFEIDTVMQAIGRKRPLNENDTYNLYFLQPSKQAIHGFRRNCEKQLEPAEVFFRDREEFDSIYSPKIRELFAENRILYPVFDKESGKCDTKMNPLAYRKYKKDLNFIQRVLATSYKTVLYSRLGEELKSKEAKLEISEKKEKRFEQFLSDNVGVKIFDERKEEVREAFRECGLEAPTMGLNKLNDLLQQANYSYVIKRSDKKEGERKGGKHGKRWWIIERTESIA